MNWNFYSIDDFKSYSNAWDKLNSRNSNSSLLSSDFVMPLLTYFSTGYEKLAIYGNPGQPEAMAILRKAKFAVWETLQPSQAPLGLWLQSQNLSTSSLLSELRKALPFPTLLVGITQQDPDLLPRPNNGAGIKTIDYIQTARVTASGNFDDYWSQRGKNLRQNLNRQRNRLDRESIETRLKIITEVDKIEQAIFDYGQLESAGWKNAGGTAIQLENNQGKFYRDMLINFSKKNNALIFQYYYADKLVSTDLCIKNNHSLIVLKTTYDETISTSSPAMLMRQEAFRYIFENEVAVAIEFYGKVMQWHTKWSDEIRVLYHVNKLFLPIA